MFGTKGENPKINPPRITLAHTCADRPNLPCDACLMAELTSARIHHVFAEIAQGRGNHGSFLTAFAEAVCAADDMNLALLGPVAAQIISKYGLTKYLDNMEYPDAKS